MWSLLCVSVPLCEHFLLCWTAEPGFTSYDAYN